MKLLMFLTVPLFMFSCASTSICGRDYCDIYDPILNYKDKVEQYPELLEAINRENAKHYNFCVLKKQNVVNETEK